MSYLLYDKDNYDQFERTMRGLGLTEAQAEILNAAAREINGDTEFGSLNPSVTCPACNGTGYGEDGHVCPECGGTGKLVSEAEYTEDDESLADQKAESDDMAEEGPSENGEDTRGNAVISPDQVRIPDTKELVDRLAEMSHEMYNGKVWNDIMESLTAYAKRTGLGQGYVTGLTRILGSMFTNCDKKLASVLTGADMGEPLVRLECQPNQNDAASHAGLVIGVMSTCYHDMIAMVDGFIERALKMNRTDDGELGEGSARLVAKRCLAKIYADMRGGCEIIRLPKRAMTRLYNDDELGLSTALGRYLLGYSKVNPFADGGNEDEPPADASRSQVKMPGMIGRDGKVNRDAVKTRIVRRGQSDATADPAFMSALGGRSAAGVPAKGAGSARTRSRATAKKLAALKQRDNDALINGLFK